MKKLIIKLENCYGIKKLDAVLSFEKPCLDATHTSNGMMKTPLAKFRVVAIYASNGMMKTSLAKTFKDLSKDMDSEDKISPNNKNIREITDENGTVIPKDNIFVVESYPSRDNSSETISTLLANPELKKKYTDISENINRIKDNLLSEILHKSDYTYKVSLEKQILKDFDGDDFFKILEENKLRIESDNKTFEEVVYAKIFNEKVKERFKDVNFKKKLEEFIKKYQIILDKSPYLRQDFDLYNVRMVQDTLRNQKFFDANHSINLHSDNSSDKKIEKADDFEIIIKNEINIRDKELKREFDDMERKIEKNQEMREFFKHIKKYPHVVPELSDYEGFSQKLWICYFAIYLSSFKRLLTEYTKEKEEIDELCKKIRQDITSWHHVINVFNSRFSLPFTIHLINPSGAIFNNEIPVVKFKHKDTPPNSTGSLNKDELAITLSEGEKRALHILDILYEIEKRKTHKETLLIIDDIVDSFDYKNKYAIVQYLKEISEHGSFKLIILTHNFDFFRMIERNVCEYSQCYFTYKDKTMVNFKHAEGIRNIFNNDLLHHLEKEKNLIASIPFARNIIEYTKGIKDDDYKDLSSLLHYNKDNNISLCDLKRILSNTFPKIDIGEITRLDKTKIYDIIHEQANLCLEDDEGANFLNKFVLAIAIRLKMEEYICYKINYDRLPGEKTGVLIEKYAKKFPKQDENIKTFKEANLLTPETIHLNSFMYEPILDMSDIELKDIYKKMCKICSVDLKN